MIEGESGILAISPAHFKPVWEPSKRRLTWPNGTIATCYSAEEPERLRGPQHDLAWCDELCAWKYQQASWDMLTFGLRLGSHPRSIITTTPKPTTFIKELIQDESVVITRGSTFDNFDNLADTFKQQIVKKYDGTRLGRQELYAEIMTDIPGALWNDKNIEALRRDNLPPFKRIIVAVDPPVTSGPDADECGIIIAGRGDDGHIYIIEDESIQGLSPHGWCERVIKAYEAFNADRVIAEVNNGGELIENLLRHVKQTVSYKAVRASRGKLARAEPICALYEQGLVHHVQRFAKLEKQMCEFTSDFNKNIMGYSPDRVDALVWAVTELMEEQINPQLRYL
jgi:predicted phage terminase large subunit-like protein